MTFLVGWADAFGGWMFADSAATHASPPRLSHTSFGELQLLDHVTVEEAVIKLIVLPRETLAAICGDGRAAMSFVSEVEAELQAFPNQSLFQILESLQELSRQLRPFVIMFMEQGSDRLVLFQSDIGPMLGQTSATEVYTAGSLHRRLQQRVSMAMAHIRILDSSPRLRQMLGTVYLQSLSVDEILVEQNVGGAFFSVRLADGRCQWQEDIVYIIYSPRDILEPQPAMPGARQIRETEMVRLTMRDGIGFANSSVGHKMRTIVPIDVTEAEVQAALDKVEQPSRYLAPSRYVAFLSRMGRRLTLIERTCVAASCRDFGYVYASDLPDYVSDGKPARVAVFVSDDLAKILAATIPEEDACFMSVLFEGPAGRHLQELHLPYPVE